MKKIAKMAFVAAFATIAGYNVYSIQKKITVSDLALNEVEALANPEIEDYCGFKLRCYKNGCCICEREEEKDSTCNIHEQVPC